MYLDNKSFITKEEAVATILSLWEPKRERELVDIEDSQGRVLALDVFSQNTLPVCRSSQMDGIGVRFSDFENSMPDTSNWKKGKDYVLADTGDDFEDEFDTVIAIECVDFDEKGRMSLELEGPLFKGQSVKGVGADLREGELLVRSGTILEPIHLCLLARGGVTRVEVEKKPRVMYIPTGNELVELGQKPKRGENIESNGLMIEGFLRQWGGEFFSLPIIKDDRSLIEDALMASVENYDIVLINGGSSMGSEDYVSRLIEEKASFFQHGIKSIPGIPISVGIVAGKPVINLPGPSLAAYYGMDWCVKTLVYHFLKAERPRRQKVEVVLKDDVKKPVEYDFYLRLRLVKNGDKYEAYLLGWDKRFADTMSNCNAIAVAPIE